MKKSNFFSKIISFVLVLSLVFTLSLFNSSFVAYADGPNMGGLAIYVQDKNNVTLTVDVQGGSGYPARLEWGDGTYVDLLSGYGQHIWHSYPYEVGWFKSYNVSLYVPGVETCRLAVGINDYCGPSFSNLYLVELGHNELTVGADVNGPGLYPAWIDWGDETYTDLPDGSGQNVHHAYAYDVGAIKTYTMTLYVVGTDPCVATYTIDDTGLGQSWMSGTTPHTGQITTWEFPGSEPVSHYGPSPGTTPINNNWAIGNTVNLAINTQIRTGSGLGYTVHTVVPVDNWPVTVINGPRYSDGYTWWDISRSDGGTGWVRQDQADSNETSPSTPQTPPSSGLTVYSGWSGSPWSGSYLQITVYNLRLRSSASLTASINGYVVQGQYYKLLETQGDWGRIETQNSTQGWIYLPRYTIITQVTQNTPPVGVCYLISPDVHWGSEASIQGHWYEIDIPKYLYGKNFEIYFRGELVPDADNRIDYDNLHTPTNSDVFTLGIATFWGSANMPFTLNDSNWYITYTP